MTKLLLGKPVAEATYAQIADSVQLGSAKITLATVGFSNAQWQQYTNSIGKSAAQVGINVENVVSDGCSAQEFSQKVAAISQRKDVCGVILQQPLSKEFCNAVEFVDSFKDVDCLNSISVAKLYKGEDWLAPATPTAVIKLLDYYQIPLQGKNVVIVGRGNAVGKPLALMMLKRNATVTVCHTKTVNLPAICRNADIIVSACGVAGLITADFVTKKSVVVDVGLSFVDGKTCGDVSADVYNLVEAVSPVPGGVGPVTRAALLENLLKAQSIQNNYSINNVFKLDM